MFISENFGVNEDGHLTVSGVDTVCLAKTYGTPLYVMDEQMIRSACRKFKSSMDEYYDGQGLVCYASKAFCCREMCRIIKSEGLGLDVVSMGELYTAMSVGFPAEQICFHGNNKSDAELEYALDCCVGRIIVDNHEELERLDRIAAGKGTKASVMFRIKPGIDAHTHSFIRTGQIDSKFGVALETGEAMEIIKSALAKEHIYLRGVHCHIGSQIFDIDPFLLAAKVMLRLIADVKEQTGYEIPELNLGGGFGIKYIVQDKPAAYNDYMKQVSDVLKKSAAEWNIRLPFVLIEPGRSIVGPAGLTLYTVGAVKEIPGIRTYVSVDGGMTDNPRYALYQSVYDMEIANKAGAEKTVEVTVAGKCCESGDLLGEQVPLQPAEGGDILAVLATGAYNYSMASHYNRTPGLPVVMVKDREPRVIVKRETMEDLIRNDV